MNWVWGVHLGRGGITYDMAQHLGLELGDAHHLVSWSNVYYIYIMLDAAHHLDVKAMLGLDTANIWIEAGDSSTLVLIATHYLAIEYSEGWITIVLKSRFGVLITWVLDSSHLCYIECSSYLENYNSFRGIFFLFSSRLGGLSSRKLGRRALITSLKWRSSLGYLCSIRVGSWSYLDLGLGDAHHLGIGLGDTQNHFLVQLNAVHSLDMAVVLGLDYACICISAGGRSSNGYRFGGHSSLLYYTAFHWSLGH